MISNIVSRNRIAPLRIVLDRLRSSKPRDALSYLVYARAYADISRAALAAEILRVIWRRLRSAKRLSLVTVDVA